MHGATYPAVTQSETLSVKIPVPPLEIQRRIVARIEELFAELDAARHLHAALVHDAERLMDAATMEVFEVGEKLEWNQRKIQDIIQGKPQYGTSEKATEEPVGVPVLRMGNIVDGKINFDDLKYISLSQDEETKFLLTEGDILFNRTNSAKLVGKTAVYPGGKQAIFASYLIRIVANPKEILPYFISYYINSPIGRQYIEVHRTRAIGQANVNATKLKRMPILVPPLEEQRRIVAYLDEVQTHAAELQHAAATVATDLDRLEQSILAQAFKGKL
jgi:type I restriction enzyme S subunit